MISPEFDQMLQSLIKKTVPTISPKEVENLISSGKEVVFLDIRSEIEFQVSHIDRAVFMSYHDFEVSNVDTTYKDKEIVVYCSVGYRSEIAGEKLKKAGFKVFNLYGGIFQWVNENFTVVDENGKLTEFVHTYNKKWSKWLLRGKKVYE